MRVRCCDLAAEVGLSISTAYRYLHEDIEVIAEQAPDLHEDIDRARHLDKFRADGSEKT